MSGAPSLEQRMDDIRAIMDEIGSRRAALMGFSKGCPMSVLFAATYPERVSHLVLFGGFARAADRMPADVWEALDLNTSVIIFHAQAIDMQIRSRRRCCYFCLHPDDAYKRAAARFQARTATACSGNPHGYLHARRKCDAAGVTSSRRPTECAQRATTNDRHV